MARNHGAVDRSLGLPSYQCHMCKLDKPSAAFGTRNGGRSMRSACRACEAERNKNAWDPQRGWEYHIRRTYGLTPADYDRMLSEQNGGCAICGVAEDVSGNSPRLSVDHDHATGKVRGLLCHLCNTALGKFDDSVERLESAKQYLLERR